MYKWTTLLWNTVYWIILCLFLSIISAAYDSIWLGAFLHSFCRVAFMILASWLIFDVIIPEKKIQIVLKISVIIGFGLISAFLARWVFGVLIFPNFYSSEYSFIFFNWSRISGQIIVFLGGIGGFAVLKYFNEKMEWQTRNEALLGEKRVAELNFLKAQIHPHFLFNTLNAIYNESLKKSDNAPVMILKLSEMLRSLLYESRQDLIPLSSELKLINDYCGLEMMRYGNRLKFSFENKIKETESLKVPALSLYAFVENAFKHGVGTTMDKPFIDLKLERLGDNIYFTIKNSINESLEDKMGAQKGIGLNNIRKQLQIIYEDRFNIEQSKNESCFISKLTIPIYE